MPRTEVKFTVLPHQAVLDWPRVNALKTRLSARQILRVPKYSKSTLSLAGRLWFPRKTYIRRILPRRELPVSRNWFTQWKICWTNSIRTSGDIGTLCHMIIVAWFTWAAYSCICCIVVAIPNDCFTGRVHICFDTAETVVKTQRHGQTYCGAS